MIRTVWLVGVAGVLSLAPGALSGQNTERTELVSFVGALASELSSHDVFAVDVRSFPALLRDSLHWVVGPDDLKELLGQDFRYGPLDLFLSCEAGTDCVLARPGVHVAVVGLSAMDDAERVTLRLDRTGGEDQALFRRFEILTLQRESGEWGVLSRRVLGRDAQR